MPEDSPRAPTVEAEALLTTADAADVLGVTTREVRRKARDGTLPAAVQPNRAAGHGYLFRRKDVEAYRAGGEGTSAGRNIIRPTTVPPEVLAVLERHTDALLSIGTLGDLPAALRETTEAVRALVEELAAARAERDRLAEELRQERARPWWRRWWPGKV